MRWTRIVLAVPAVVALSACVAEDARAQRPDRSQQDPISLLRVQGVRKELEIEPDQQKQIEAVQKEMDIELDRARQEITARYQQRLEKVLQPQQAERLQQISLQVRGVAALTDPEVAKKLGLSESQLNAITGKREEASKKLRDLFEGGGAFSIEAYTKIQEDTNKAVLGVLSEEQQKKYETLKGKEIDRNRLFRLEKRNPDT